jgi:RNA polymerase sigma-70 factor (ECF subfamily)
VIDEAAAEAPDLETLVARAQRGDKRAFNQLVTSQYRFIFRVAYRVLGHKSDAEDVTQTVCMRLATGLASFDGRSSFTSWLYRVTLNAARDYLRSQARRGKLVDGVSILAADYVEAEQDAQRPVEDIWQAVRSLPEKQREAVILVHGEELSQEEAARIMDCKKVTVAWHLHNARKALREML